MRGNLLIGTPGAPDLLYIFTFGQGQTKMNDTADVRKVDANPEFFAGKQDPAFALREAVIGDWIFRSEDAGLVTDVVRGFPGDGLTFGKNQGALIQADGFTGYLSQLPVHRLSGIKRVEMVGDVEFLIRQRG